MLLERLRIIATDPMTDTDVKGKCQSLYRQWATLYQNTEGMSGIANLYRQLPQRKRPVNKENSQVLRETEQLDADDEEDYGHARKSSVSAAGPSTPGRRRSSAAPATAHSYTMPASLHTSSGSSARIFSTSGFKDKERDKKRAKPFNLEKEKPQMNHVITQASIESTNLMNALMHINREKERVSENPEVEKRFEICKQLRRQTYRYCVLCMDERYLGTLLRANDQLSDVLVLYEQLDKSFDYDSDSEDYEGGGTSTGASMHLGKGPDSPAMTQSQMAAISLDNGPPVMPSRPTFSATAPNRGKAPMRFQEQAPEEEEDEDNPFADKNAVNTPMMEKKGMDW